MKVGFRSGWVDCSKCPLSNKCEELRLRLNCGGLCPLLLPIKESKDKTSR